MLEKVNLLSINTNKSQKHPAFKSNQAISYPQVNTVPAATAQYGVKVPTAYIKTGELNLPYDLKAHCYKLANGQRVIIVPKEGETVLKTYVGTGSMNEPDHLRGISHYIEHNLFNGSEGLESGEFFKTASNMGAYTNASTGFAVTDYIIDSNLLNKGDLEKEIKIHSSMIETPKFAPEMLEKEKGIVNTEINMCEMEAYNVAGSLTLKNLFNIETSSKDLVAGSTDNITKLTRADVVDYYNNNYFPANMVTVVTGEVNPDETIDLISKYFSGTNKTTHPRKFQEFNPVEKTVRQDIKMPTQKSTLIQIGFSGPKNNDVKNEICFDLVADILNNPQNGRLKKALKPYRTGAEIYSETVGCRAQDPEMIICETETNEENCEKVLQEMYNQIYSVITDKNYDLDSVKKNVKNAYEERFDSSLGINSLLGRSVLKGNIDGIADFDTVLNSVTKEDLANFVKEYLNLNRAAVTVVHPDEQKKTVSFTGTSGKQTINENNVQRYRSANNFEILTNKSATNLSFINLRFITDDDYKGNPTAAALLSYIFEEGSAVRDSEKFSDDMAKQGIRFGAYAARDEIFSNVRCGSQDLNTALAAAIEVLYNPNITPENFEHAKKSFEEVLLMKQKTPVEKLHKELFNGLPEGLTYQDLLENLRKLTIEDVRDFHAHVLKNGQANITVSAPFDKKPELKQDIFNKIAALDKVQPYNVSIRNTYKPVEGTKVLTDTDQNAQARIIEAFKFKSNRNLKDEVAVRLLNSILGGGSDSRLFNDLREKQQLAYHVGSEIGYVGNSGVLSLSISTTTDNSSTADFKNVQKSIDGFNKHVKKMITEKVTEEELNCAKLNYKNILLSGNETTCDKNSALSASLLSLYGPLVNNEILKIIDQITVDDIYNAANYIFKEKPTYSIVATDRTLKENEEYLKSLEK